MAPHVAIKTIEPPFDRQFLNYSTAVSRAIARGPIRGAVLRSGPIGQLVALGRLRKADLRQQR